jgi:ankyrin repeat protein
MEQKLAYKQQHKLIQACYQGDASIEYIQELLADKSTCDVNVQTLSRNPLQWACETKRLDIVQVLLEHHAIVELPSTFHCHHNTPTDNIWNISNALLPLTIAVEQQVPTIVNLLLAAADNAEMRLRMIRATIEHHLFSPTQDDELTCHADRPDRYAVKHLFVAERALAAVDHSDNIDSGKVYTDKYGTPYASIILGGGDNPSSGCAVCSLYLTARQQGHERQTARLLEACAIGDEPSVQVLLDLKADVHTEQGNCLRTAASWNHSKLVVLLLDANATVDAVDSNGATALALSSRHGHRQTPSVLVQLGADVYEALHYHLFMATAVKDCKSHTEEQYFAHVLLQAQRKYHPKKQTQTDIDRLQRGIEQAGGIQDLEGCQACARYLLNTTTTTGKGNGRRQKWKRRSSSKRKQSTTLTPVYEVKEQRGY